MQEEGKRGFVAKLFMEKYVNNKKYSKGWGGFIKKLRVKHGMIFVIIISFCTLFLNFEIFPVKAQKEVVEERQVNLSTENQLSLNSLFKLTINPRVPSFILQGNYAMSSLSPQKDCIAYLYPDEWETVGDIYIRNNNQDKWTRLELDQLVRREMWGSREPAEALYTPKKKVVWLNNEDFITIIGYALGTVSTGGDLVKVNRVTGQAEILYPAHLKVNQEATDFEISGERLTVQINVMDEDGLSLDHGVISIPLDKVLTKAEIEPVWEKTANSGK